MPYFQPDKVNPNCDGTNCNNSFYLTYLQLHETQKNSSVLELVGTLEGPGE